MAVILVIFATLLLIAFLLDWIWRPKLNLPLPSRLPVIGHLASFIHGKHIMLTTWAKDHGDVYCIHLLNQCFVVVNSHEAISEVLSVRGKDFAGKIHTFRGDMISENGQDILLQSMNPNWKRIRMFTHQHIKQYGEGMGHIEKIVIDKTQQFIHMIHSSSTDGIIDPFEYIYLTIANNIVSLITGTSMTLEDPLFQKIMKSEQILTRNMSFPKGAELDIMPWLRFFGNQTYKNLCQFKENQQEIYHTIKNLYRSNDLSTAGLAYAMINEMETNEKGLANILSDDVVKVVLYDIILGGVTTSVPTFHCFLLIMASHPEIQQRFYEEVFNICTKNKHEKNQVSLAHQPSMPFVRACLLELTRYASVLPIPFDHTAMVNTQILHHPIPQGTPVLVNLFSLHHDERYWENPWHFNPYRFLDEDGQLLPSDHIHRKRLMAFGAGPRHCIGQTFAMARLFILTTSVIKEFAVSPVPGEPVVYDPRMFENRGILYAPRVNLCFKRREIEN